MKQTDFMIGDLLKCTDKKCHGMIVRISNICKDGCELTDVEPIPITPEILEANSIRHYKDCGRLSYYKRREADFTIRYEIFAGYIGIELVDGNRISVDRITKVHELQHVMRLIGLNDMADNFKVKGGQQ